MRQRKFREREGAFLVEGADLVAAGVAAGHRPQVVFVRQGAEVAVARLGLTGVGATGGSGLAAPQPAVYPVAESVAGRISTLDTPPEVMAVFPLPQRPPLQSLKSVAADGVVVYADGVGDPGNAGTLLRAAVAFAAAAFAAAPGSVDLYGPKTVRAGMGASFGLPMFPDVTLDDVLAQMAGAEVYGLAAHGGVPPSSVALRRPAVLVVGAERSGLSAEARARVTRLLTIPLALSGAGLVESLNAGVAGAIVLYEFSRRHAEAT